MARLNFRLTSIALNDEEEVSAVTAIVRPPTRDLIVDLIGPDAAEFTPAANGFELMVTLPARSMHELFSKAGKLSGTDPRYEMGVYDLYDSLSMVVYRLCED